MRKSNPAPLVSVTSAGQITPVGPTPYFVLIDRALRDEGTSLHYLPPTTFAEADAKLVDRAFARVSALPVTASSIDFIDASTSVIALGERMSR